MTYGPGQTPANLPAGALPPRRTGERSGHPISALYTHQPEFGGWRITRSLVIVEEEERDSNVRPRLLHTPPGVSRRCMLLRKSTTFSEMSMKNNVTTASNSPSPGENVQKVTLDELDGLVWPVVRHRQGGVARRGVSLMCPFGHKGLQDVLVQRARVVR